MGRRVIAIVAALVVALVGAAAVVAYASSADQRAVAGQQVVRVFIAKAEIPKGMSAQQAMRQHLLAPAKVVAKGVPAGALTNVADHEDPQIALAPIAAGSIVLDSAFGVPPKTTSDTAVVPKGKIAITVDLPDPQRIAPLLKPGSHIVIYDTYVARNPDSSPLTPDGQHLTDKHENVRNTIVLLPDVEVIAVGQQTVAAAPSPSPSSSADGSTSGSDGSGDMSTLVTVAVSADDATLLVHGIQTGTVYAGLRGAGVEVDTRHDVSDNTVHVR